MEHILYEQNASIGSIILNKPKQRNALSLALLTEMKQLLYDEGFQTMEE